MEKKAARSQVRAEKLEKEFETKYEEILKGKIDPKELEEAKKAYGRPRSQEADQGVNLTAQAEQEKGLGLNQNEEKVVLGDLKAVQTLASRGAKTAFERLFGEK